MHTNKILTLISLLIICAPSFCQVNLQDYVGDWEGNLPSGKAFSFEIRLVHQESKDFFMELNFGPISKRVKTELGTNRQIMADFGERVSFSGQMNKDGSAIEGFIKSGILFYHVDLVKTRLGAFVGKWNLFMVESLDPATAFLAFEVDREGNYAAYTIFGDLRFAGTWAGDFNRKGDALFFRDFRTGLRFQGILEKNAINLDVFLAGVKVCTISYRKSTASWKQGTTADNQILAKKLAEEFKDGWKVNTLASKKIKSEILSQMEQAIFTNKLTHTHAVSIAKEGELVYDEYFFGYHQAIPHDQRSAAKSLGSAAIGLAIADGVLTGIDQKLYSQVPQAYQYTLNEQKSEISIHDLLTMSSGLDAIDFGIKRTSAASEGVYQSSSEWLKTVLEAPMIFKAGAHCNYGSANPFLLGVMLDQALDEPLEFYIDRKLFKPLGITNYLIQGDRTGKPYFGGGWFLTPRDMLKFGQLYLNKGKWNGKQILTKDWVEKSFGKYGVLENTTDKNEYGYLWWHKTYQVNGQAIKSIEARGAGGQYIAVVPSLELVVAITSGNFRNGRFAQPEQIMQEYILPAVLEQK